ncbi:DUF4347 domain-containing protein, partial [Nisaea nitritireducens]|uniref:DUF4347 domain-containing protein n=1 Tax=Nisaea nitritireducens TaxID=568392 RepID=UPI0018663A22
MDNNPEQSILFVDPEVPFQEALIAGLRPGFDVVHLPSTADALTTIALHMLGRRNVPALHVLSHGESGAIRLSGHNVGLSDITARPELVDAICDALAEDAEIVLYGCSVAHGQAGRNFVDGLSDLLNRSIVASEHMVGARELGGAWDFPALSQLAFDTESQASYPGVLAQATFGIVTTIESSHTLTTDESGTTINVERSDSTPMAGVSSGFLDAGLIANTVSYTLTFASAVNITQFQIGEFQNNSNSANYTFTPNTGSAVTIADNDAALAGSVATLNPADWNNITSFTVSYAGGVNWRVGLDNIIFTSASVSASSNAAGFNTTNGTNLTPASTFGSTNDTLTIASATHTTGSTADGGGGTDTLVISQTGTDLTQLTSLTNFETLTLGSNVTVTMSETQHDAFSTINGAAGVEAITLSTANGDGNITGSGNIETYNLNNAFTFTIGTGGQNVTGNAGSNQTVQSTAGMDSFSGILNGGAGGSDTLVLDDGDNIASATVSNFENLTFGTGASVTMTVAQHDGFTGTVTAAGTEQVTFSATGGDTVTTGNAAIETYVLGTGGITFTLGTAAQNVTGSSGADTVNAGTFTATGTLNGSGGTDTLSLGTGANIAGATVSSFENLTLTSGASVTMAAAQSAQFSGTITAAGSETVSITGDGNFTTLANIETYSVGDDSTNTRTITIGGAGTSVTANSATDAVTFNAGGLTLTGTLTGEGTVNDTLQLGNNASISGATISNIENLTVDSGASVTMTVAQHDGFTGGIAGTGTNQITFSATGGDTATTGDADIEAYVLGTGGITFALGAAAQNLTGSSGADTLNVGTLTATGTLNGNGGTDTLSLGTGANIAGATVSSFENLTLTSGASVTMAAAQSAQFSGTITAAGSETVSITGDGNFTTLANIE